MGVPSILNDPRLMHFADRARIDCDKLFEFACPLYWGGLRPTAEPGVRICEQCAEKVYFTSTPGQLLERTARGLCVAVMMESETPSLRDLPADEACHAPIAMGRVRALLPAPSRPDSNTD